MKVMKQSVFYTQRMYTGLEMGGYPCKWNTKNYLQKVTVGTVFKRNVYVGSSSKDGNPEKRLHTVLYKLTVLEVWEEDALYKNMRCKMNSNALSKRLQVYTQCQHLFLHDHPNTSELLLPCTHSHLHRLLMVCFLSFITTSYKTRHLNNGHNFLTVEVTQ